MTPQDYIATVLATLLLRVGRLPPGRASEIMSARPAELSDAQHALDWFNEHYASNGARLDLASWENVRAIIDRTVAVGIEPVVVGSDRYPSYLANIVDAPPVIFVRGNVSLLDRPAGVAIVGTRKASPNGTIIAERIANFFGEQGWTVVSGLALGIDAAAHRGALKSGGPTIAVLAHGLQSASPRANAHLADEILDSGGAWVSEYPIDVRARPEQFVHRNRIQIGLSAGSIIVEGEERSGTMTQAEFCIRNRRHLFAVFPEKVAELKLVSEGPLILINKRGATALRSREDYAAAMEAMQALRGAPLAA